MLLRHEQERTSVTSSPEFNNRRPFSTLKKKKKKRRGMERKEKERKSALAHERTAAHWRTCAAAPACHSTGSEHRASPSGVKLVAHARARNLKREPRVLSARKPENLDAPGAPGNEPTRRGKPPVSDRGSNAAQSACSAERCGPLASCCCPSTNGGRSPVQHSPDVARDETTMRNVQPQGSRASKGECESGLMVLCSVFCLAQFISPFTSSPVLNSRLPPKIDL